MYIGPWGMFGLGVATGSVLTLTVIIVAAIIYNHYTSK